MALTVWLAAPAQRAQGKKWMDWSNGTLSPAHRPVLMGLGENATGAARPGGHRREG